MNHLEDDEEDDAYYYALLASQYFSIFLYHLLTGGKVRITACKSANPNQIHIILLLSAEALSKM